MVTGSQGLPVGDPGSLKPRVRASVSGCCLRAGAWDSPLQARWSSQETVGPRRQSCLAFAWCLLSPKSVPALNRLLARPCPSECTQSPVRFGVWAAIKSHLFGGPIGSSLQTGPEAQPQDTSPPCRGLGMFEPKFLLKTTTLLLPMTPGHRGPGRFPEKGHPQPAV